MITIMDKLNSLEKIIPFEVRNYRKILSDTSRNIAIVGLGKMGLLHGGILNLIKPGFVSAIVENSRLLALGASRLLRGVRIYKSLDDLINNESPDAVFVTTPAHTHYSMISKLLEASVPGIFVEKPPTLDAREHEDLLRRLGRRSIVMVGLQKRFALPFRHAREILSDGALGEILGVRAYIKSGDILEPTGRFDSIGRGVLLDLGIHLADLLLWILGDGLKVKRACYSRVYTGVDDYFKAELRSARGYHVFLEATWSSREHRLLETVVEVKAEKGVLRVSEDYLYLRLEGSGDAIKLYKPHYYRGLPPVNLADPEFTLEDIHFLYSLMECLEPETSLGRTLEAMRLVDELYATASEGGCSGW